MTRQLVHYKNNVRLSPAHAGVESGTGQLKPAIAWVRFGVDLAVHRLTGADN